MKSFPWLLFLASLLRRGQKDEGTNGRRGAKESRSPSQKFPGRGSLGASMACEMSRGGLWGPGGAGLFFSVQVYPKLKEYGENSNTLYMIITKIAKMTRS